MDKLVDQSDMLKVIKSMPLQIKEAYKLGKDIHARHSLIHPIHNIVVCGMGGSSISGDILKSYIGSKIPVYVIKNYDLPEFIDKHSLVFIVSYSGNTEESISCYRQANKKGCTLVIITSGGKLHDLAEISRYNLITVSGNIQPRNAVAYLFFPMLNVLNNAGLIENKDQEVNDLIDSLGKEGYEEIAKNLGEKLVGKIPIIYASELFYCVAYRWKTEFNENPKIPAFCHYFPELDHNEMNGYVNSDKIKGKLHIIMLKNDDDNKRIIKRMEITKKLISKMNPDIAITEINIKGNSLLTKLFTAIYIGDLASYYLALKYGIDPTPVEYVEELKKELGPFI